MSDDNPLIIGREIELFRPCNKIVRVIVSKRPVPGPPGPRGAPGVKGDQGNPGLNGLIEIVNTYADISVSTTPRFIYVKASEINNGDITIYFHDGTQIKFVQTIPQ